VTCAGMCESLERERRAAVGCGVAVEGEGPKSVDGSEACSVVLWDRGIRVRDVALRPKAGCGTWFS
jgi:hypothetical protein